MSTQPLVIRNGQSVAWADVPRVGIEELGAYLAHRVSHGGRLVAFSGMRRRDSGLEALAVVADDSAGTLGLLVTTLGDGYAALTLRCPQAHHFERELHEQWGVVPEGHPWLRPVRFPPGDGRDAIGIMDFFQVEGEEIHEVGVGPVHAGIIEPGHFRFCCHGEDVLHLEISLGYQHRGVERALVGGPDRRTIHYLETVAGDTSVGHALAYCEAVEALGERTCTPRAARLRAVALELERIANHVGDLGALAGDVGYLPTASYCGGLRGDVLNLTALLCGSRLGRGLIRPGGLGLAPGAEQLAELRERLARACQDTARAADLMRNASSVRARFERIGILDAESARSLGMVGPAARASGVAIDVRRDHPTGAYHDGRPVEIAHGTSGDVFARAEQRVLEIERSARYVDALLADPGDGECLASPQPPEVLASGKLVVSLVEGWRGEICHIALTGEDGRVARYKVVDPSFHNWYGLALALRGQAILDFPVCNKSFNLSYCGHDL